MFPIDDAALPAPITRRDTEAWTVRLELFRNNALTGKTESCTAVADCRGHNRLDAVQNLLDQIKAGVVTFR